MKFNGLAAVAFAASQSQSSSSSTSSNQLGSLFGTTSSKSSSSSSSLLQSLNVKGLFGSSSTGSTSGSKLSSVSSALNSVQGVFANAAAGGGASSQACQSDVQTLGNDLNACFPGVSGSAVPSKLTQEQYNCVCNSATIPNDFKKVSASCGTAVAGQLQQVLDSLQTACNAGSTTVPTVGSPQCQQDLTTFMSDVQACVPNAASSNGVTDTQLQCLCDGTISADLDAIVSDCGSDTPADVADFQNQLKTQCGGSGSGSTGGSGQSAKCTSAMSAFENDFITCIPSATSPDLSTATAKQLSCICSGPVAGDISTIINTCDASTADGAATYQDSLVSACKGVAGSVVGGSGVGSGGTGKQSDKCTSAMASSFDLSVATAKQLEGICSGPIASELSTVINTCDATIVSEANAFQDSLVKYCKGVKGSVVGAGGSGGSAKGGSTTGSCDSDLVSFKSDFLTCIPDASSADISKITSKQVSCICNGPIMTDLKAIINDCDASTVSDAKDLQKQLAGVCPAGSIGGGQGGNGTVVTGGSKCNSTMTTLEKDFLTCIPNPDTIQNLNFTTTQLTCLCNSPVAIDLNNLAKDCATDKTTVSEAKSLTQFLVSKCPKGSIGASGGNSTTTNTTTTATTTTASKTTSVATSVPTNLSGACQNDVLSLVADVNQCVPGAITAGGTSLPANFNPSQQQISCLCQGNVMTDASKIATDCQGQDASLVKAANDIQMGLGQYCPKKGSARAAFSVGGGVLVTALLTLVVGFVGF
ncbi:hypothetical protein HDU76_013263 [Blyttiomyces sp. JEL0837]|nr:hypothetical protein HDU76_013263 [Blyttiomyces sp. JEL0837]